MRNKRFLLALIVVVFSLVFSAFGFAAFSSGLSISGTVKGEGSFDVYFAKSAEGYYKADEVLLPKTNGATVTVTGVEADGNGLDSGANDKLNVTLSLESTDKVDVTFPVKVYNNGTVAAEIEVASANSGIFTVTTTQKVTVGAGETATVNVRITSSTTLNQKSYKGIILKITATQPTIASAPTPTHDHDGQ